MLDTHRSLRQVDVANNQPQQFTPPHAGEDQHYHHRTIQKGTEGEPLALCRGENGPQFILIWVDRQAFG